MKYEYSIREVTRYLLTEYSESDESDACVCSTSKVICEFDHKPYAQDICNRLNAGELNEFFPHLEMTLGKA